MENIKKATITEEQAIAEIMGILEGAEYKDLTSEVSQLSLETIEKPEEVTYDGYGHKIAVNGKSTAKGYVKGAKRVSKPKDAYRADFMNAIEVVLSKVAAFDGKVGRNKVEGIIIRMEDADYAIKISGHTSCEFFPEEEGFKPEKNFMTRGKTVNHSSAIAKLLTDAIENSKPEFKKLKPESEMFLCAAKASGIRFQVDGEEFTIKISKKRARVVID